MSWVKTWRISSTVTAEIREVKGPAWRVVFTGYAAATVGLLAELSVSGESGIPSVVTIGVGFLIAIGVGVGAIGLLQVRRSVDPSMLRERRGLELQAAGLVALILALVALQISSAIPALLVGSAVAVVAAGLASVGAFDIRRDVPFLLLGTVMIFGGLGLIVSSQIGYYFVLSDVANTVVNDAGIAVSACGCVVSAYASLGAFGSKSVEYRASIGAFDAKRSEMAAQPPR
jgi:hypothetical protein